jgi:hypothetical protein
MSQTAGTTTPTQSVSTATQLSSETPGAAAQALNDENLRRTKDFGFLPIPPSCRYDPDKPIHFGLVRIIVFGLASTFSAF